MTLPKTPRYEVVVIGGGIVGLADRLRRGPLGALGGRGRARAAPRHPPDGAQLQRHPLRALLRPRWAEGAAGRRGVRGDRRVLPRARPAAPGVRQARRRHRARGAAADEGARPPRRRQRRREPRARPGGHAGARAARARDRRAVGALHRDLRLPGRRREAGRARRQGGRGDPPRPVGHQRCTPPRRRRGPRRRSGAARHPGRGVRGPALRRAGPRLGGRPRRADRAVPRRVRGLLRAGRVASCAA